MDSDEDEVEKTLEDDEVPDEEQRRTRRRSGALRFWVHSSARLNKQGPRYQARSTCEGWKSQVYGGNLPFLATYPRIPNHRHLPPRFEGRGYVPQTCSEANFRRSED